MHTGYSTFSYNGSPSTKVDVLSSVSLMSPRQPCLVKSLRSCSRCYQLEEVLELLNTVQYLRDAAQHLRQFEVPLQKQGSGLFLL